MIACIQLAQETHAVLGLGNTNDHILRGNGRVVEEDQGIVLWDLPRVELDALWESINATIVLDDIHCGTGIGNEEVIRLWDGEWDGGLVINGGIGIGKLGLELGNGIDKWCKGNLDGVHTINVDCGRGWCWC